MYKLSCSFQGYDWGKIGPESKVYALLSATNQYLPKDKSYAELWMGDHKSCPSKLEDSKEFPLLSDLIAAQPDCLGHDHLKSLPFLFKVLSIRHALSIQVHPNKLQAVKLHQEFPNIYKDPNHKPELAIALTQFEGLIGFRPMGQIKWLMKNVPHLNGFANSEQDIKQLYCCVMTKPDDQVKSITEAIHQALQEFTKFSELKYEQSYGIDEKALRLLYQLYLRLYGQFPGDVGCISIFFLNYLTLEPGQAMFLDAGVVHAYLSGDCIECMANSDNVVRAGLTPKLKDVTTLLNIVKFESSSLDRVLFASTEQALSEFAVLQDYRPPVEDFAVERVSGRHAGTFDLPVRDSATILLIVEGQGHIKNSRAGERQFAPGAIFFVCANETITCQCDEGQSILFFRARYNSLGSN